MAIRIESDDKNTQVISDYPDIRESGRILCGFFSLEKQIKIDREK